MLSSKIDCFCFVLTSFVICLYNKIEENKFYLNFSNRKKKETTSKAEYFYSSGSSTLV